MSLDPSSSVSSENNLSYLNQENEVKPIVVRAQRSPTTADRRFKIGTLWVNQVLNQSYQLTSVSGGLANWVLLGMGTGDLETLTGDSGGAISPDGAGNINLVGNFLYTVDGSGNTLTVTETTGAFPTTPFVVGAVGEAGYQTIQSALDAANAVGGGSISIQGGTFTEDLTLFDNVCLGGSDEFAGVTIIGIHTPPLSGVVVMRNMILQTTTSLFSSVAAGSASIVLLEVAAIIGNGFTFDLPNWTGNLAALQYFDILSDNGISNNTAGAIFTLRNSNIGNGNTNTFIATGDVEMRDCQVQCSIDFQTGADVDITNTTFTNTMTFSNDSTGTLTTSNFKTDPDAAIIMSSTGTVSLSDGIINTTNDPAIDGTGVGTFTISGVNFQSNFNISGSLSLATGTTRSGNFIASTIGDGIEIAEGLNARQGAVGLVAGTATVPNTTVNASSRIFLTSQLDGGTPGFVRVSSRNVGVDFTITSSNAGDTSAIAWIITEPA